MSVQGQGLPLDLGASFTEDAPRPPVPGEEGELAPADPRPAGHGFCPGKAEAPAATPRRSDLDLGYEPEGSASPTPPHLRWAESLHSLLDDQDGIRLFRAFLRQERCADLLDFWFACSGFRKLEPCGSNEEKRLKLAKAIYRKYILDSSGIVSRQTKPATKSFIRDCVARQQLDPAMFEQAQMEVQSRMEEDTYPSFLKSDVYLEYTHTGAESPQPRGDPAPGHAPVPLGGPAPAAGSCRSGKAGVPSKRSGRKGESGRGTSTEAPGPLEDVERNQKILQWIIEGEKEISRHRKASHGYGVTGRPRTGPATGTGGPGGYGHGLGPGRAAPTGHQGCLGPSPVCGAAPASVCHTVLGCGRWAGLTGAGRPRRGAAPGRAGPLDAALLSAACCSLETWACGGRAPRSPRPAHRTKSQRKTASGSAQPSDSIVVAYYFCGEPIPYRTLVRGRAVTLGQFKELLTKKGNYRYYFKRASDEFDCGVVFEEVREDGAVLPVFEEKVVGKVDKLD
ncbi:PREDICTED: axin-1 [Condylura cristata]|uniref:axin-1 n=1 Tax=Condylura cristata TaxID=143302 RepID=UPI000642BBA9|nr:PREDICTED: axin-1 [Condylura cristata]